MQASQIVQRERCDYQEALARRGRFYHLLLRTLLITGLLLLSPIAAVRAQVCANAVSYVVTDKVTLAGLTVDEMISCDFRLGVYVTGGDGGNAGTGVAPAGAPGNLCGLSFAGTGETPASALNSLDHHWLQSTVTPKVVDFGSAVSSAFVFVAVDHAPFPEEGIESTVWGSNSSTIAGFPAGWTLATLTTIWKKGWIEPAQCEPGDNADDFVGQYTFAGAGFRYVAVHANCSISIFDDPSHGTWASPDDSAVPGWQSYDDEIDAVGTPVCASGSVVADAGPDRTGAPGQQVCFDAGGSTAPAGIATISWDLNCDGVIDATGPSACTTCSGTDCRQVTVFVTDLCGCVDTDTARFGCGTVPAVSTWGLGAIGLLLATGIAIKFGRRRAAV